MLTAIESRVAPDITQIHPYSQIEDKGECKLIGLLVGQGRDRNGLPRFCTYLAGKDEVLSAVRDTAQNSFTVSIHKRDAEETRATATFSRLHHITSIVEIYAPIQLAENSLQ